MWRCRFARRGPRALFRWRPRLCVRSEAQRGLLARVHRHARLRARVARGGVGSAGARVLHASAGHVVAGDPVLNTQEARGDVGLARLIHTSSIQLSMGGCQGRRESCTNGQTEACLRRDQATPALAPGPGGVPAAPPPLPPGLPTIRPGVSTVARRRRVPVSMGRLPGCRRLRTGGLGWIVIISLPPPIPDRT